MAENIRVLMLDDDINQVKLLELFLKRAGMVVDLVYAATIEAANAILEKDSSFDICIVDHRLPRGSGFDFVKAHRGMPFIYSTYYLDEKIIDQVKQLGGTPLDKNEMLFKKSLMPDLLTQMVNVA